MTAPRQRADRLLVERGLFESRAKAQAAIEAGLVTADDVAGAQGVGGDRRSTPRSAPTPAHPYVSRGGVKLAAALDHFGFDPRGRVCLDVGASTGGFTQVLLERGAQARLRRRCRPRAVARAACARGREVVSLEETDIRALDPARLDAEPPDLVVVDVSFISLKLVLPAALALAQRRAQLVALIKPQFEAGRAAHRKRASCAMPPCMPPSASDIAAFVASLGWRVARRSIPSPIAGGDGNREFLLGARA